MSNGVKTKLMNLRVPPEERQAWDRVARSAGKTTSQWLRDLANDEAERAEEVVIPRDKVIETVKRRHVEAKKESGARCKHEGYEHTMFCYKCGQRT